MWFYTFLTIYHLTIAEGTRSKREDRRNSGSIVHRWTSTGTTGSNNRVCRCVRDVERGLESAIRPNARRHIAAAAKNDLRERRKKELLASLASQQYIICTFDGRLDNIIIVEEENTVAPRERTLYNKVAGRRVRMWRTRRL